MGVLGQPCVVLYLVGNVHQNVAKLLKAVVFLRQCLREDVCAFLSGAHEVDSDQQAKVAVSNELLPKLPVVGAC